ncbi:hypothetical protein DIPPA_03220 [Diplonema papillatum]|nr:hypothetical protein DIPPA_03220 [Diplonema papillatum]
MPDAVSEAALLRNVIKGLRDKQRAEERQRETRLQAEALAHAQGHAFAVRRVSPQVAAVTIKHSQLIPDHTRSTGPTKHFPAVTFPPDGFDSTTSSSSAHGPSPVSVVPRSSGEPMKTQGATPLATPFQPSHHGKVHPRLPSPTKRVDALPVPSVGRPNLPQPRRVSLAASATLPVDAAPPTRRDSTRPTIAPEAFTHPAPPPTLVPRPREPSSGDLNSTLDSRNSRDNLPSSAPVQNRRPSLPPAQFHLPDPQSPSDYLDQAPRRLVSQYVVEEKDEDPSNRRANSRAMPSQDPGRDRSPFKGAQSTERYSGNQWHRQPERRNFISNMQSIPRLDPPQPAAPAWTLQDYGINLGKPPPKDNSQSPRFLEALNTIKKLKASGMWPIHQHDFHVGMGNRHHHESEVDRLLDSITLTHQLDANGRNFVLEADFIPEKQVFQMAGPRQQEPHEDFAESTRSAAHGPLAREHEKQLELLEQDHQQQIGHLRYAHQQLPRPQHEEEFQMQQLQQVQQTQLDELRELHRQQLREQQQQQKPLGGTMGSLYQPAAFSASQPHTPELRASDYPQDQQAEFIDPYLAAEDYDDEYGYLDFEDESDFRRHQGEADLNYHARLLQFREQMRAYRDTNPKEYPEYLRKVLASGLPREHHEHFRKELEVIKAHNGVVPELHAKLRQKREKKKSAAKKLAAKLAEAPSQTGDAALGPAASSAAAGKDGELGASRLLRKAGSKDGYAGYLEECPAPACQETFDSKEAVDKHVSLCHPELAGGPEEALARSTPGPKTQQDTHAALAAAVNDILDSKESQVTTSEGAPGRKKRSSKKSAGSELKKKASSSKRMPGLDGDRPDGGLQDAATASNVDTTVGNNNDTAVNVAANSNNNDAEDAPAKPRRKKKPSAKKQRANTASDVSAKPSDAGTNPPAEPAPTFISGTDAISVGNSEKKKSSRKKKKPAQNPAGSPENPPRKKRTAEKKGGDEEGQDDKKEKKKRPKAEGKRVKKKKTPEAGE